MIVEYLIDDFDAANRLISNLPHWIKKKRFNSHASNGVPSDWKPAHLVVAKRGVELLALADLVDLGTSNEAASLSIVATQGNGVYAIKCLEVLKLKFPRTTWTSTLKEITPTLKAISTRHVDVTFDQISKELSEHLIKTHGEHPEFIPAPIFTSQRTLRKYSLPPIKSWSQATLSQFITVAKNPMRYDLISPSGDLVGVPGFQSMCFDVFDATESERQGVSRATLIMASIRHGHQLDTPFMKNTVKHKGMKTFITKIHKIESGDVNLESGSFQISKKDLSVINDVKRKLGLPNNFKF